MSAVSHAHAGDTILLAGGNYGAVGLSNLHFSSAVTIRSASDSNPAVFNSFKVTGSENITLSGVTIHLAPTATSQSWDTAVGIYNSSHISIANSAVSGGPAVNGVAQTATALDSTGNVIGLPAGQGFTIVASTGVSLSGNTVAHVNKGVSISSSSSINISGNSFTDMRHGAVGAGGVTNLTISGNQISGSHPWAWDKSYGDHADFIHIWTTPPSQVAASSGVVVTGNVITQGDGAAIMGINLQASAVTGATPLGFTGANISNNAIVLGNAQGMRLENLDHSTVSGNTLLEPASGGTATPGILFALAGATHSTISGNIAGSIVNKSTDGTSALSDNHLAQDQASSAAGYFNAALATQASQLHDPAAIRSLVMNVLSETTTSATYKGAAATITANLDSLGKNAAISTIVVTDNAPVKFSLAQWQTSSSYRGELVNQNGAQSQLVVTDTAAKIVSALDTLNGEADLAKIVVSDNQAIWLSAAQGAHDAPALAKLVNANGAAASLNVKDTAANVSANIDGLAADTKVTNVWVADKGVIEVNARQLVQDQHVLSIAHGESALKVVDTGANILANLGTLHATNGISKIVVSDHASLTVTASMKASDVAILSKLVYADGSAVKVAVGATASASIPGVSTHDAAVTSAETSVHVYGTAGHDTFEFLQAFSSETVSGFDATSDHLAFDHRIFASASAALASATNDGHGDVVLHAGAGETITLTGVTLSQLTSHPDIFSFF